MARTTIKLEKKDVYFDTEHTNYYIEGDNGVRYLIDLTSFSVTPIKSTKDKQTIDINFDMVGRKITFKEKQPEAFYVYYCYDYDQTIRVAKYYGTDEDMRRHIHASRSDNDQEIINLLTKGYKLRMLEKINKMQNLVNEEKLKLDKCGEQLQVITSI